MKSNVVVFSPNKKKNKSESDIQQEVQMQALAKSGWQGEMYTP